MSNTIIIISFLSVFAGYVSQAINTGSIFGVVTVPKTWLPYLTLFGTFLTAGVASIVGSQAVSKASIIGAVLAGLTALTGTAVGVTMHQHINACPPANDNAKAEDKKAA